MVNVHFLTKSEPKTVLVVGSEASVEELVKKMREIRKFGEIPPN